MTPAQAKTRLGRMCASDTDPGLSSAELDELVVLARRADVDGLAPSDAGWEPTYDFASAAAEGWASKAGRTSDRFAFSADDQKVDRQQVHEHCLAMAAHYAGKVVGVLALAGSRGRGALPAGLEGWQPLLPGAQGPVHTGPPYIGAGALPGAFERGDNTA